MLNSPGSFGAALAAGAGGGPGLCDGATARRVSAIDKTGYRARTAFP
jgi:hypothetical protein